MNPLISFWYATEIQNWSSDENIARKQPILSSNTKKKKQREN
jgi:hypothetical protein